MALIEKVAIMKLRIQKGSEIIVRNQELQCQSIRLLFFKNGNDID